MRLNPPLIITARLMPGVRIGDAFISLVCGPRSQDGRTRYECFIDLPGITEHQVMDMSSGCQGGSVREGITALLSFLSAAVESYQYGQRTGDKGENTDLFPPAVVQWAAENSDEISSLQCELDEGQS